MNENCTCFVDGYCPRYRRKMTGRLRQICAGENIAPEKAEVYRSNWLKDIPLHASIDKKLILTCFLSPGDLLAMTVAIHSLHTAFPNRFETDVRTSCNEVFAHNPFITPLQYDDKEAVIVEMHYPTIDRSNQHSTQFVRAYTEFLGERINSKLEIQTNRPMIYFTDEEENSASFAKLRPYWIINAGGKRDYTCKQWPIEYYQEVVDSTCNEIQWIQIGENHQNHHALNNVVNMIGKTSFRELMVLALHSSGGLGPVTALMHLMAGVEKPYICINGGREPIPWIQYQLQHTLHTMGQLDCCATGACWKSRVVELPADSMDPFGSGKLNVSLCEHPNLEFKEPVAECMAMIRPDEVITILKRYANVSTTVHSGSV